MDRGFLTIKYLSISYNEWLYQKERYDLKFYKKSQQASNKFCEHQDAYWLQQ